MSALVTLTSGRQLYLRDHEPDELLRMPKVCKVLDYGAPPPCMCCRHEPRRKREVVVNLEQVVTVDHYEDPDRETST